MRPTFPCLAALLLALAGTTQAVGDAKPATPPNLIVILCDDLGYNDLGCFGSPLIATPRIDALAREGMRFIDFYAQTVCGPSRAALMTGCYPLRVAEWARNDIGDYDRAGQNARFFDPDPRRPDAARWSAKEPSP